MLSLAERCRIAVHAARATAVAMDAMIASTLTCEKLCTWPQVIAKCPVSMPAASHTPATTMRALLALVLSVGMVRSEEHTSELQSQSNLVCRLLLEKKNTNTQATSINPRSRPPCYRGPRASG